VIAELTSPAAIHGGPAWSANRSDWHAAAIAAGMIPLSDRATQAIEAGWTTREEVVRVLGITSGVNSKITN